MATAAVVHQPEAEVIEIIIEAAREEEEAADLHLRAVPAAAGTWVHLPAAADLPIGVPDPFRGRPSSATVLPA